jgi:hypothetical protein
MSSTSWTHSRLRMNAYREDDCRAEPRSLSPVGGAYAASVRKRGRQRAQSAADSETSSDETST